MVAYVTDVIDSVRTQVLLAAEKLAAGEVTGLPTETVYGLAADATKPSAVREIFTIKNRPSTHPLITHIAADALDQGLEPVEVILGRAIARAEECAKTF